MEHKINQEQLDELFGILEEIGCFENLVEKLCEGGKDDIVYGFALGKIHMRLAQACVRLNIVSYAIKEGLK